MIISKLVVENLRFSTFTLSTSFLPKFYIFMIAIQINLLNLHLQIFRKIALLR